MTMSRSSASVAVLVLIGLLGGCGEETATAPAFEPRFTGTGESAAPKRVTVCKVGPVGTYDFTAAAEGGTVGTLLLGPTFTVDAGQCVDVWEATPTTANQDPLVTVTVGEASLPAGIQFDSVVAETEVDPVTVAYEPTAAVQVNFYHGARITFYNSEAPPPVGGEGCTPGYWKNRTESWTPTGYTPADDFDTTFGVDAFQPDFTLLEALRLKGGRLGKLGRHGTAALLSATHPDVGYGLTAAAVIDAIRGAVESGAYEPIAEELVKLNEQGCPL